MKIKTYAAQDIATRLEISTRHVRRLISNMLESERIELGIYRNSGGWQVPVKNYKFILKGGKK